MTAVVQDFWSKECGCARQTPSELVLFTWTSIGLHLDPVPFFSLYLSSSLMSSSGCSFSLFFGKLKVKFRKLNGNS